MYCVVTHQLYQKNQINCHKVFRTHNKFFLPELVLQNHKKISEEHEATTKTIQGDSQDYLCDN